MRTNNLRNKPVDRRYLSDKDKSDYNQSGEYAARATALSRARGRKGAMAYEANRPMNTQSRRPGTGSFGPRDRTVKPMPTYEGVPDMKAPSAKGDLFKEKQEKTPR